MLLKKGFLREGESMAAPGAKAGCQQFGDEKYGECCITRTKKRRGNPARENNTKGGVWSSKGWTNFSKEERSAHAVDMVG